MVNRSPIERIVGGRRPWWWKLNPWHALANRERVYAEALDELQALAIEHDRLRRAAIAVVRWDWSDNDDDCVADIRALAKALDAPPGRNR